MQPLHPHPPTREIRANRAAAQQPSERGHPSVHGSPAQPEAAPSLALISKPQTPPHVRLQRSYFRPCVEPGFSNSRLPLPRAIPGKPKSRGYNLQGKRLCPSNSTLPVPTPFVALYFSNPTDTQDVGYLGVGRATMPTLGH